MLHFREDSFQKRITSRFGASLSDNKSSQMLVVILK